MYLMHPDGTGEKQLLAASNPVAEIGGLIGMHGRFSRDSRKVLFSRVVLDNDARPVAFKSADLLLVDVDGAPPKRFLERVGADFPTSACWSPDGKEIAVLVIDQLALPPDRGPESRIEIVDLDGNVLEKIALPGKAFARDLLEWR
jgi:Tol biopolymer transport system component